MSENTNSICTKLLRLAFFKLREIAGITLDWLESTVTTGDLGKLDKEDYLVRSVNHDTAEGNIKYVLRVGKRPVGRRVRTPALDGLLSISTNVLRQAGCTLSLLVVEENNVQRNFLEIVVVDEIELAAALYIEVKPLEMLSGRTAEFLR